MTSETNSSEDGEVVVECGLDASPEKVWRALTVPELAADWLGAMHESAPVSGESRHIRDRRIRYRSRASSTAGRTAPNHRRRKAP